MSLDFANIKKILIPIDGSDYSIRAAELGISVAKIVKAEIMVVYVIDTVVLDQIAKVTERESAEQELKQDGDRYIHYVLGLAEKQGVRATSLLARGRPFEQVVQLAKGLGMDLIVMGTYGRRGAERILIGSVAERVIEYASCPVLVVK
ncbi:MAG: universal stress protein [Chloroflexi bacterium]|nr:universal stress protein [Chloroflexota bacterium]